MHEYRLKIENSSTFQINRKKRPLVTIQSISGQNKRFASLGKESGKVIKSLIEKHQMTIKKSQPIISLQKIELDYNGETIILNYESQKNNLSKIDAIVRACDESLLSRDGYRRLAAVESCLLREYLIANRRIEITNLVNEKIKIYTFNINKNEDAHENLEENNDNIDNIIVDDAEIGNGCTDQFIFCYKT